MWEGISHIRVVEHIPSAGVVYPPLAIMPGFDFSPFVVEMDALSQNDSSSDTSFSSGISSCVADKDSDCACTRSGMFYPFLF